MRNLVCVALCSAALLAAETPALTLLVGNKDENSLAFVDPATGKVLGRVATGEGPHEVAASADGKLAFVANYGTGQSPGSTISVIDAVNMKEVRKVNLGPMRRPHGLAVADGKLYFTVEANRIVGRYDWSADRIDWAMGTGQNTTHMVVVSKDGTVFTANIGSDTITIIDRTSATAVPVGKGPEAIDLSPDGKELWTGHSRDGGVSIIDVASKKVIATMSLGTKRSNRLKFTPDGKHVLISDLQGNDLFVLDTASRSVAARIDLGGPAAGTLIDPSGSRAFVSVGPKNSVAVIDLQNWKITSRVEAGPGPDGLAWVEGK